MGAAFVRQNQAGMGNIFQVSSKSCPLLYIISYDSFFVALDSLTVKSMRVTVSAASSSRT